jgi:hypothetical protein
MLSLGTVEGLTASICTAAGVHVSGLNRNVLGVWHPDFAQSVVKRETNPDPDDTAKDAPPDRVVQ